MLEGMIQMKKILYVMDCNIFGLGGSEKSTLSLANGLKKQYDVAILSRNDEEGINEIDGITHIFYRKKNNRLLNYIYKMNFFIKYYKKNHFNIVNVQNPRYFIIIAFLLKFKIIKKNSTFIYTDRNLYETYTRLHKYLFKKLASKFDMIICTTEYNAKFWKNINNNVAIINNSIEDIWFKNDIKKDDNKKITIGFCGRFVPNKRWDIALEICKKFVKEKNVYFSFAISTDINNIEYKKYKKELFEILGNHLILQENISDIKIIDFYDHCDIFILTSDFESFGRTLIEAMARECIVFGTKTGGVPEVIPNEFVFDNTNIDNLIKKINVLLSLDKKKFNKIKKDMKTYAKSKYECDVMLSKYKDLYN